MVKFRDVLNTTLSSITPSASPFIMRRRMPGTIYCPVPSGVWVTIEPDTKVSTARVDWSYQSVFGIVLDRGTSALFPWFVRGLVMNCLIVRSWLDSTRSTLTSGRSIGQRVGCRLAGLLDRQVDRRPRLARLLDSVAWRAGGLLYRPSCRDRSIMLIDL
jgi:hypothetical protein